MYTNQDTKWLKRIRTRLRIGRRKQSNVSGINRDTIEIQPNVCYNSVLSEHIIPDHDEEFHVYDNILICRVPVPSEGRPLYESANLRNVQIPSAQNAEMPHEIPVQTNAVYGLKDTPNEYEN